MSNADSRIPEKIEDSVIREKYVCDGKLNCQIRCPMCPSKILPIKSAKLVEFSKKLPGKQNCLNPIWESSKIAFFADFAICRNFAIATF